MSNSEDVWVLSYFESSFTDEVEILFNKLCQGIVRQDLQVALSSNAKQYEQFAVEKLVEEVSVKLPQDYETNLQQMRNLKSVALQVLKKVEEFDAENV